MQVKIKLEGPDFDSSLPGSFIIGLAQYQENIYRSYQVNKNGLQSRRKLTPEEMKLVEIKVTVKPGSTEVWIKMIADALAEVVNKVPAEQIPSMVIDVVGIAAAAYCLVGIGSVAVKEAFKTKRKSLAEKKAISMNELEKKKFELLESTINNAIEAMRAVSTGIVQAAPSQVTVNDKVISTESIASIVEEMAPKKADVKEEQSVITGTYRIQRATLDFKKDSASVDVLNVDNGEPLNGIVVQHKHLSDGSYRILKTAQDKNDVKLQLIITKRNDSIHKAVLDKIL